MPSTTQEELNWISRMAEREGFEPRYLAAHLISSQAHSTTLPPLRKTIHYADQSASSNPLLLRF